MRKNTVFLAMILLFSASALANSLVIGNQRVLTGSDLSGLVKTAKEKI